MSNFLDQFDSNDGINKINISSETSTIEDFSIVEMNPHFKKKQKRKKIVIIVSIISSIVIIGIILYISNLVVVKYFKNQIVDEVIAFSKTNNLKLEINKEYSNTIEEHLVIKQDIKAKTKVL
ncbi:MAG: hypothetical protein ACRCTA_05145, partial [Bacilli bacterium]